ncbi:MAG: nitroreductase family protein [Terrimicrobiaceae bacterium]
MKAKKVSTSYRLWKRKIRGLFDLIPCYIYDLRNFVSYSSSYIIFLNERAFSDWLIAKAHPIEKGLSYSRPKRGFGSNKIKALCELILQYLNQGYSIETTGYKMAVGVLLNYSQSSAYAEIPLEIRELITRTLAQAWNDGSPSIETGAIQVNARTPHKCSYDLYLTFVKSRHSIRSYVNTVISHDIILHALHAARFTPTACNRQPYKAYNIINSAMKQSVLNIQPGNQGFGDTAPCLLVITGNLNSYFCANERNQVYLDVGLFVMNLTLAFHSMGLGACILNWSVDRKVDKSIHSITGIPKNELVICLITVGYFETNVLVPASLKRNPEDLYSALL